MLEDLSNKIREQRTQRLCALGNFALTLDDADRARLQAVLDDPEITASEIASALREHAVIGADGVRRHRRRHLGTGCTCP